ncbi:MAG: RNA polymerase factor sigma-54 [Rhizobacter sp.]
MKPSLQLRLSAHLALTPQLQQSIRLLQLSTLELQQEVEQMLEQNPFLDVEEDIVAAPEPLAERLSPAERLGERESEAAVDTQHEAGDDAPSLDGAEFGTTEREDWENGTERDDFDGIRDLPSNNVSGEHSGDDFDPQERQGAGLSLQDHLRQQLLGMRLSLEDEAALQLLIESVNDDGYLASSIEELADGLTSSEEEAEALIERLRCALKWLQHMDPLGVGARDLGECLVLQLRAQPRSQAQMIAIIVCKQHLELLAKRDLRKLMSVTGADEDLLRQAQALITALEPKPGRPFARAEDNIIIPDVIVQKVGRSWRVQLNPDVMPKLRVNDMYANAIKQQRGAANQNAGLSGRLQEARWFVKNIMQRFDTIQRVSQAIVERQKNFFSHGAIAMKPLVLREIADELGLHESTISRVTTAKYMATPFGTFELKYFFGSSLNTEAGGNASSTAVRALIKQLVEAENPKKPLSDNQLSTMLEEQGIQVARRTVAKYREALKIAPANLRKAM